MAANELFNRRQEPLDSTETWDEEVLGRNPVEHFKEICTEMADLYERKNADYGDSFSRTFREEGMAMARIRLSDKLNRFKQLTREDVTRAVSDESVRDTLIDLANYAVMTAMEMEDI